MMPYDVKRKHGIYWVYICGCVTRWRVEFVTSCVTRWRVKFVTSCVTRWRVSDVISSSFMSQLSQMQLYCVNLCLRDDNDDDDHRGRTT